MNTISIIIPVRNEEQALPQLLVNLVLELEGFDYQIIVIDDGDDNTDKVISQMTINSLTYIRRCVSKRNGLSGAVIDGLIASKTIWSVVMDGDGQHPPEVIRRIIKKAINEDFDMIIASRYIEGGSSGGLEGGIRKFYSYFLRILPRIFFPKRVGTVTDPLSGCFLIKTKCLNVKKLRPIGWKIGLEVLLFSNINRYGEISYEFQERIGGESKANFKVGLDYLRQMISLVKRFY
ncbi:MAG: glycosyltransferase [Candidatus Hodarchaeales archaeon]